MKNILFDFDGTIMDTNGIIIRSWQHTFRSLQGREGDIDVILKTFGEPLEASMENMFPDVPVEESVSVYREFQRANFLDNIQLFPGIRELLEELKDRGYPMAMVTSRLRFTTDQALEKFNLRKYFKHIVTADDVSRHKPDPQCVEIALSKLGTDSGNSMMIGDTIHDILCARNAGVPSVLVAWSLSLGGRTRGDFASGEAPDHIVDTPEDLLSLL